MPLDPRSRTGWFVAAPLDLPPPFRLVTLREAGDAFAHARSIAADEGAGSAAGGSTSATSTTALRSTRTPRPTSTPHKKITTDTTVAAMNRKTNCLPFSWIS